MRHDLDTAPLAFAGERSQQRPRNQVDVIVRQIAGRHGKVDRAEGGNCAFLLPLGEITQPPSRLQNLDPNLGGNRRRSIQHVRDRAERNARLLGYILDADLALCATVQILSPIRRKMDW